MRRNMNKIFYIMGKSATGKDTIYSKILQKCDWLKPIVLYTTRPMRDNEIDGITYHFCDSKRIEKLAEMGRVIESRTYNTDIGDWTYATVYNFESGVNYISIGTLQSFIMLKEYFQKNMEFKVVPIYLEVSDRTRIERAVNRENNQSNPNYKELCRRFLKGVDDFSPERIEEAGINKIYITEDSEECLIEIMKTINNIEKE